MCSRRRDGFTLVEILVTVFIVGTAFLSLTGLMSASLMQQTERTLGVDDDAFASAWCKGFERSEPIRARFALDPVPVDEALRKELRRISVSAIRSTGWSERETESEGGTEGFSELADLVGQKDFRGRFEDEPVTVGVQGPIYRFRYLGREGTASFQTMERTFPTGKDQIVVLELRIVTYGPGEPIVHAWRRFFNMTGYGNKPPDGGGPWEAI